MKKKNLPKYDSPHASFFGAKLQEIRRKKGLTQAQLAEKIGVQIRTISYYEREAKNPTVNFVEKIAKVLGVTKNALMEPNAKINIQEVPAVIKSLKQRVPKLAALPRREQESLVLIIDGLLNKHGIKI